jgi:PAS domain S-box-containing protein
LRAASKHPHELSPLLPNEGEDLLRRTLESITDYAIFLLDPQGHVATWSLGAQRIKGYSREEIIGKHFSVFYPQAEIDRGWPQRELREAERVGRFEDEGWRVRRDGSLFWASVVITAIKDDDGKLLAFSKVTRDLTDRMINEERLRSSEERFRMLVENVQDYAIFLLTPEGHVATWNVGAQRIKGYAASEIIGKHFSIFYTPESIATGWPQRELQEATRLGRFEDEGWRLRKDGSRFWANVVITALFDAMGELRGFSKITQDLTERRAHEERVRQSEERFRLLLEGIEDYAIFLLDPEGRVTSWNTGAQKMTGWTAAEIVGHSFERFFTSEDLENGAPAAELRNAVLNRRSEQRGWRLHKDGRRFWADSVVTSLHDTEGRLRGFSKVVRDLSEKKRIETLEEQGRHLTEFLAMLAHELRNPLAPIRNAVGILALGKEQTSQAAWARDVIDRQTTHLTRLVDDLLDVSRITRGKLRLQSAAMDVRTAVMRAVESSRPLIDKRRQQLKIDLPPEPVMVHGDLTRVTQVASNLLNNAAKYTQEGGDIGVSLERERGNAVLRVRDNGAGIPPQLMDVIFDLFAQGERTIDRSEGGLGIGLTLARRIVVLHGGSIEALSAGVGKGAEFIVRLPLLDAEMMRMSEMASEPIINTAIRRQVVLVVDDNEDAASSTAALLRLAGHDVDVVHDGQSALDCLAVRKFDVMLLDIGLPRMNGYDVAREARSHPNAKDLRIFAMTGYGHEEDRKRSLAAGFAGHLVKPVMPAELLRLIDAPAVAR